MNETGDGTPFFEKRMDLHIVIIYKEMSFKITTFYRR